MSLRVPEHDVAALWLKVPGCDEDGIAHLDPDAAFHLSTDSTDAGDAVCALDEYSVVAEEVLDGPVELAWTGCEHLAEVGLAEDLSLTHTISQLECGSNIKGQKSGT